MRSARHSSWSGVAAGVVCLGMLWFSHPAFAAGEVQRGKKVQRVFQGNVIVVQKDGVITQQTSKAIKDLGKEAATSELKVVSTEEEIRPLLEQWARRQAWDRPTFFEPPRAEVPLETLKTQVIPLVEMAHYGWWNDGTGMLRYYVAKLTLINGGDAPLLIRREDVAATIGGKKYEFTSLPSRLVTMQFQHENQSYPLKPAEPFTEWTIPAKAASTAWLLFAKLETDNTVPDCSIALNTSTGPITIDVTRQMRAALMQRIELIGPRASLGLVAISGSLNTVNAQDLCRGLEQLTLKKVERAVITWDDSVKKTDSQIQSWLMTSAQQPPGNRPQINYLPEVPAAIQEIQLANIPNQRETSKRAQRAKVIHLTAVDAISAALADAYRLLPADEILREIESGHPLAKPAALLHGAGRLPSSELPRVIALARSDNKDLAKAAVLSLGEFSEEPAREQLAKIITQGPVENVADAAEALATSRYATHQALLLKLLQEVDAERQTPIIAVLSATPRAAWADALAQHSHDPSGQLRPEVLAALVVLGHPSLPGLIEEAIRGDDAANRKLAFEYLTKRNDRASRELALEAALAALDRGETDTTLDQFLRQVRDPRVLPKLMARLEPQPDKPNLDRSGTLRLIGGLADASVGKQLAEKFDSLKPNERSSLMMALREMRSPEFLPLALKCIESDDSTQALNALQGIMQESPPNLLEILEKALARQTNKNTQQQLMQMIGQVGTPEARQLLLKLRDEAKEDARRDQATAALLNMRQRSPGFQFIYQAQAYLQQKQKRSALECYEIALEVDEFLPEAWAGRGNLRLQDSKIPEAKGDFEKAVALDPTNAMGVTGYAICLVSTGEVDKGLETLEKIRAKHAQDDQYLYNAACVYGRALEQARKNMASEDVISRYKSQAIKDLKASIDRGFDDYDWAKKDPDLKSLENDPEFKTLMEKAPKTE